MEATPRAAVAGGLVVILLLGAMLLLHPGERPAVEAGRTAQTAVLEAPASDPPQGTPATSSPDRTPAATEGEDVGAPDNHPPTF